MRKDDVMPRVPATARTVPQGRFRRLALAVALAAGIGCVAISAAAMAAEPSHLRIATAGGTQSVVMDMNKSLILDLPADAAEVIVSQPGVANAILRNKRRAVLQSVSSGDTNMFFLDGAGRTIVVLDVRVKGAVSNVDIALRETFARILPGSSIQVDSIGLDDATGNTATRLVLSGSVQTADDLDKAVRIAGQFAGAPENVTSVITVAGAQQVMLKVTVAEVRREVAKQLGINLSSTFSIAGMNGSFSNTLTDVPNGVSTTMPGIEMPFGSASIDVAIRALENRNAVRMLAEPVLTAMSGQPADFLAGGELPYDTYDADGNRVTSFKSYGVQLSFTPTVKAGGIVSLVVKSSVSEPTGDLGALNRRDVSTTVELGVGQTLSIAGLIDNRSTLSIDSMPGLGDIPILGALFRSRDFRNSNTELVFLVTPYLARPTNQEPVKPTDKMVIANDAEQVFLGRLESIYGVGPGGTRGSYDGNVGFLLD